MRVWWENGSAQNYISARKRWWGWSKRKRKNTHPTCDHCTNSSVILPLHLTPLANICGDLMIDALRSLVYIVCVPHKCASRNMMPFAPGVKQPSAIVHVTPLTFSQINLPHTRLPISLHGATSVHADRGRHNIPPTGECICSTRTRCMTDWVKSAAFCHRSEQP